mmetsp:Transcript_68354/g.165334  ORF Transcript_68354/g.165334 Transcript_68354/m.165334 type:complete len:257 (+) Transcript_68354:1040-1810(+)
MLDGVVEGHGRSVGVGPDREVVRVVVVLHAPLVRDEVPAQRRRGRRQVRPGQPELLHGRHRCGRGRTGSDGGLRGGLRGGLQGELRRRLLDGIGDAAGHSRAQLLLPQQHELVPAVAAGVPPQEGLVGVEGVGVHVVVAVARHQEGVRVLRDGHLRALPVEERRRPDQIAADLGALANGPLVRVVDQFGEVEVHVPEAAGRAVGVPGELLLQEDAHVGERCARVLQLLHVLGRVDHGDVHVGVTFEDVALAHQPEQ